MSTIDPASRSFRNKKTLMSIKKGNMVFLFVFLLPLIFDIFYTLSGLRLGIAYRGLLFFIVFLFTLPLLLKSKNLFYIYLITYPLLSSLISAMMHGEVIAQLVEASKYSYLFILFIFLGHVFEEDRKSLLLKYVSLYGFCLSILILVPFSFGFGQPTYFEGAYGNKGLFSAQNDVGISLAISFVISSYIAIHKNSTRHYIAMAAIAGSMLILGTRLGIIASLSFPVLMLLKLKLSKKTLIVGVVTLISISTIGGFITSALSFGQYELSKFENLSFGDKGRFFLMQGALDHFEQRGVIAHLFGDGIYGYLNEVYKNLSFMGISGNLRAVEMDIIDVFGQFGLLYLIAVYYFLINLALRLSKKLISGNNFYIRSLLFAVILILFHSALVGHTLNNPLLAPVLASLLYLAYSACGNRGINER